MAESWQAKAKRYVRGDFTKAELMGAVGVLLVDQLIDIATFGRLSNLKGKAFVKVALPLVRKTVTRAAPSVARAAFGASRLLMSNPYIAAGTAIYVGYHEREKIKQLLDQGYEIVQEAGEARQEALMDVPPIPFTDFKIRPSPGRLPQAFLGKKRRPSAFNKAVKAGMAAVKKSTSYGKKGTISPAKKVFSVVVKLASAKLKKKKAPKSGIRRRIWNAMRGLR